ncbi:MAG: hypothetical protein L0H84_15635 [Pseudonocardia sp.]|nr:hypothetical protein [Pseudonocardia sp.]
MTGASVPPSAEGALDDVDEAILKDVTALYTALDPVPPGLADRVLFSIELEGLEAELAQLDELVTPAGARTEEAARTITFSSRSITVMVTPTPAGPGRFRMDGWAAPGAGLPVELRTATGSMHATADETGRFEFVDVPAGRLQFVFHPGEGSAAALQVPVVTPAVEL